MSKDDEINELREEIEELKDLIKNLSKSQAEAYKNLDEEKDETAERILEKDIDSIKREKERIHGESLHPERPRESKPPRQPLFPGEEFRFEFDSEEFKEKLKDLKKKVEKATKEGLKTAEKVSERMKKEFNKFLELETDKITKTVGLTDDEYKDISRDIEDSRKDVEDAQRDVEEARENVEKVRRASLEIRRRLERAYRENDLEKQVETEKELRENEQDLRNAMEDLSNTRVMLSQIKREFARLHRRAAKIHTAQKDRTVRVIGSSDFDVDGTISEYVSKVVNSVGKNLECTLRTAWGEGKKAKRRMISISDKDDIATMIQSNGRVETKALEEFYDDAADLLSALGDKNRLKILKILELSPQYQKELAEDTGLKGGTFKHHTDILQDENFITREAIRGRYLITQLGIEALKLAEMIYLRKKRLEDEFEEKDDSIDIDID